MKVEIKKKGAVMLVDGVRYKAKPRDGALPTCPTCAFHKEDMIAACKAAPCMAPSTYFVKAKKGPWIGVEGRNPGLDPTTVVEWVNRSGARSACEAGRLGWGGSNPVVRYRVFQQD